MKIEPTYVTFEQEKLLNQKGFDVELPETKYSFEMPQQWQVMEWLRVVHGIWIKIDLDETTNTDTTLRYHYECIKIETDFRWSKAKVFDTPQEAYSASFDYILKELI